MTILIIECLGYQMKNSQVFCHPLWYIFCDEYENASEFTGSGLLKLFVYSLIIVSSIMQREKENIEAIQRKAATPFQILSAINKTSNNRERILKQLEQLGVDLAEYEHMSLQMLIAKTQTILKNTYSVKYLGLNKNQMGIISRRINPFTDQNFKVHQALAETYSVHKYFYPKPLKIGKKESLPEKLNVNNLQSEIKREFQEQQAERCLKIKQYQEKHKKKVSGSWCTAMKTLSSAPKRKASSPSQIAKQIAPQTVPTQSFSRFLTKGILIVRD